MAQAVPVVPAALTSLVPGQQLKLVKVVAPDLVQLHRLVVVAQVAVASSLFTTQPVALQL
jgi:hypothetical protein